MIREKCNRSWQFAKGSTSMMSAFMGGPQFVSVDLPHDAMVHEERTPDTANGTQTGYWPGGLYTYVKKLDVPKGWQDKTVQMEFEGVYATAMVYVNGNLAKSNLYGYSNFYVTLDKYLNYGEENEIRVVADNGAEKNSRWYSGSGIYRNVNLLVGGGIHIPADGVSITTPEVSKDSAVVEVCTGVKNITRKKEKVTVEVTLSCEGVVAGRDKVGVTMFMEGEEQVYQRIALQDPKLWSTESPNLYDCTVKIYAGDELLDEAREHFGIRKLELDPKRGLRINGEQVKLRGTCIHHDNGIIGATTLEKAEERRCRQMKEAGFNSIRSAHHPMSKAMLDACDRVGMLVMDELCDMWTNHKNANDFALHFLDCVDTEVERMVKKDYNHPSVILYSAGNEIPDLGTARGAQINRMLCNRFHALDPSRYTTNAVNGMLALGPKMGEVIGDIMSKMQQPADLAEASSDTGAGAESAEATSADTGAASAETTSADTGAESAETTSADTGAESAEGGKKEEGASALNSMMALMVGPAADAFASHPLMTECIEEACQGMDITGLNYLTGRHELEKELHPNKTVVGTETYPADIVRLWDIVKNNAHVLGDYTWTGYDYLGEAGCGIFYYDGTQNFNGVYPDRIAYIGDIDIIGYRRPISYLREIVFGLRKEPYIAVERVDRYGMAHSQTAWMLKDNIASWTWPGYEGKPANVDIYSDAEEVELFLNGKSMGRKPAGEGCGFTASYEITYEPGKLLAISYVDGRESGQFMLHTAYEEAELSVTCEGEILKADGEDLAFITVKLVDKCEVENLFAEKEITVSVEGAGTLQGFGNADPRAIGSYDNTTWKTYNGYVMAVVRAGTQPGEIKVKFEAEGCRSQEVVIKVQA